MGIDMVAIGRYTYGVVNMSEAQETSPVNPVIYGIFDARTGYPVYIGKTRNLRKRVECYRNPKQCHNRCRFEIALAMDHYGRYRLDIERWLSVCQAKLIGTLEPAHG